CRRRGIGARVPAALPAAQEETSMTEPGSARERDVLLAAKLYVPRPPPGFVARPRLAGRLDEGLSRRLILVCAPAGAGQAGALAAWARGGARRVAWLSLDEGDNDPARFWRYVAAALERSRPGISGRIGQLLRPALQSFEGVVAALVNELADCPPAEQALLVLDDYHLIGARQVHASVQFLLGYLPPGLPLVLATRADPPL